MKIEIQYSSLNNNINIFADTENNIFICNNKVPKISIEDFKEKLLDIIIYWDNDMTIENYMTDAEKFIVSIETDEDYHHFTCNGLYPDNFDEFKNLLQIAIN